MRDLLDGTRTVADVAALSELGRFETSRALFLLMSTGHARPVLAESGVAVDARGADLGAVLIAYNGMFTSLQQHLRREVGPIAVQMLERCLREARAVNPSLLDGVTLSPDGALDGVPLERNLQRIPAEQRREAAIGGLNELLYSGLLAVKRTLGKSHEAEVVRLLRDQAPPEQSLGV